MQVIFYILLSQFKTLVNLVEQKATDFKAEIIEANKQISKS